MQVEVRLFATLRHYLPDVRVGDPYYLTLPEGATVADVLSALGVPVDDTKQTFVNGRSVEFDYVLGDGDRVGVFPPIAGGAYGGQ